MRIAIDLLIYKTLCLWYRVLWSAYNPWAMARMNIAWQKYTQTTMYEERKKLEELYPVDFKDFAFRAYIENKEMFLFWKHSNWSEKLKIIFTPFSCKGEFVYPLFTNEEEA